VGVRSSDVWMRLARIGAVGLLVVAGCGGGGGGTLTLRAVEAAVRSAGLSHTEVLGASVAIARLRAQGADVAGLREGTPDYVVSHDLPVVLIARYATVKIARGVLKPYATRVCNVVVLDTAPNLAAARHGATRVVGALRKRCH
jgi:hypothetical protein